MSRIDAPAVAPLDVLVHFGGHADVHQPLNAIVRNDCGGSVGRGRFVRQALFALLACIERVDRGDGARDAVSHMLLLARGKGQRAHDQTALLPRLGLSGLIWRSEFDHISKTNRYRISRLIARAVSGWQSDLAWLEHVAQDGVEHAVEFRVW